MSSVWGDPDFVVEREIDEFGIIRPTDDFANAVRIVVQCTVSRLPFNYYVNDINRQPANAFFGKLTVFNEGFLREEIPITHWAIERDIEHESLAISDSFISTICRIILLSEWMYGQYLCIPVPNALALTAVTAQGRFLPFLTNGEAVAGVPDPDPEPRFPTPRISKPRFDEIRVKFIEEGMRGKLKLLGWRGASTKCCDVVAEPPPDFPEEPPKDPPDVPSPFRPDTPDDVLPEPDPPYDGGEDDGRTKPPGEDTPGGEECTLYQVRVRVRFGASSSFFETTETFTAFGEIGDVSIQGTFPPGQNGFLTCRGIPSTGSPACGEFRAYPFTGFSNIEIDEVELLDFTEI